MVVGARRFRGFSTELPLRDDGMIVIIWYDLPVLMFFIPAENSDLMSFGSEVSGKVVYIARDSPRIVQGRFGCQ